MEQSESVSLIIAALVKVQSLVRPVGKSGDNKFDKYKYSKLEDYQRALEDSLENNGLIVITTVTDWTLLEERKTQKGGIAQWVKVKILLKVFHVSGEWISIESVGEGQDRADKSTYKAITGARKYGVAMLFDMVTTDDPEATRKRNKQPNAAQQNRTREDQRKKQIARDAVKAAPKAATKAQQKMDSQPLSEPGRFKRSAEALEAKAKEKAEAAHEARENPTGKQRIDKSNKREWITAAARVFSRETGQLMEVRDISSEELEELYELGEEVIVCEEEGIEVTRAACINCFKLEQCKANEYRRGR